MRGQHNNSCVGPLRTVVELKKEPFGPNGGSIKRYTLDCGHTVTYLFRPDLTVGKRTGCKECQHVQ